MCMSPRIATVRNCDRRSQLLSPAPSEQGRDRSENARGTSFARRAARAAGPARDRQSEVAAGCPVGSDSRHCELGGHQDVASLAIKHRRFALSEQLLGFQLKKRATVSWISRGEGTPDTSPLSSTQSGSSLPPRHTGGTGLWGSGAPWARRRRGRRRRWGRALATGPSFRARR